jgi:hypothetical protein
MFVMVKCGVLFEVRTGFINIIYTSIVFKGLRGFTVTRAWPVTEDGLHM